MHIQRLQVGAGQGRRAPHGCEGLCLVPVDQREGGAGAGEGTRCPGVCQRRAEAPWARCHPRPAVGKIRSSLSPGLRCQRWAVLPAHPLLVPPATPQRAGTPLPGWL